MDCAPQIRKLSLIRCSIPAVIIALLAALAAALGWAELGFSNTTYYLLLALAAWCPLSKLIVWSFWRRNVEPCVVCVPVRPVRQGLQRTTRTMATLRHNKERRKEDQDGR